MQQDNLSTGTQGTSEAALEAYVEWAERVGRPRPKADLAPFQAGYEAGAREAAAKYEELLRGIVESLPAPEDCLSLADGLTYQSWDESEVLQRWVERARTILGMSHWNGYEAIEPARAIEGNTGEDAP